MEKDRLDVGLTSFGEVKVFLTIIQDGLVSYFKCHGIYDQYENYSAEEFIYSSFENNYTLEVCLKLLSVVQNYEVNEIVEYGSEVWWLLSGLDNDVDMHKMEIIIQEKIKKEDSYLSR